MGLKMERELSVEQLIARQDQLNKLVGQREETTKRLGPESIDFKDSTPREVRTFGIKNRVRASIDRLKTSLSLVDNQLEEHLPQIANDYRRELIRKERDLRGVERSGLAIPEETLASFRSQLQELKDKPSHDIILAKALGTKVEKPTEPQASPPPAAPLKTLPEITLNKEGKTIKANGKEVPLTAAEWVLMNILYGKNGEKITISDLRETVKNAGVNSDPARLAWGIEQKAGRMFERGTQADKIGVWSLPRKTEQGSDSEKIGETDEENIRKQTLLEAIHSFNLIETRRKVLEVAVSYNKNALGTNDTWVEAYYGEDARKLRNPKDSLDALRSKAIKEVSSKISLVSVTQGEGRDKRAGYYLKLVEAGAPKPPAPEPEFGAEPVQEVVLNLLNRMIEDPNLTLQQAIELRGLSTKGRPFNKSTLRFSLSSAVNILMYRQRMGTSIEEEKKLINKIHSILNTEDITSSLKTFRVNTAEWIKDGTPIIPVKADESPKDYRGRSTKAKKTLPDGQEIEIRGQLTAVAFDLIINSTKENPVPTEKADKNAIMRLRKLLGPSGYKIIQTLKYGQRNTGQKGTYYLEEVKTQISPEQQEEIVQLEQSLVSLLASRPTIAEAASLGLPGNHTADLQQLDTLVTQKQDRLKELKQA